MIILYIYDLFLIPYLFGCLMLCGILFIHQTCEHMCITVKNCKICLYESTITGQWSTHTLKTFFFHKIQTVCVDACRGYGRRIARKISFSLQKTFKLPMHLHFKFSLSVNSTHYIVSCIYLLPIVSWPLLFPKP